jgi:hypothetical protein
MDYSEIMLELSRNLNEMHKATTVRNFEVAEQYSENFVRLAHTLQHTFTTINLEDRE